ncbi:MAG TPA: ACP S-malonyltransferase [Geobacteraceae bacterium]|nr:ACP S-malonyltransferase [Geobacteraceae bacterium]
MNAFVFPGQGSQYPGMGKELAENFRIAMDVFREADDILGWKLSRLCFEGPEEDLRLTANTQPAILAASVAVFRVLTEETGLRAGIMAGHSLGEYSALVASGALKFSDAIKIVHMRGKYMQDAVPVGAGAMAAVLGVEADVVREICNEAAQGEIVVPANFNSPGQIVIAGQSNAVHRAIETAKSRGFRKVMLLPVSVPSHCGLMAPAGEQLSRTLQDVEVFPMQVPVVSNVEAKANSDSGRVKELLVEQLSSPVLWDASIQEMISLGATRFFELGPGKVLCGLIKRIDKTVEAGNVEDIAGLKTIVREGV